MRWLGLIIPLLMATPALAQDAGVSDVSDAGIIDTYVCDCCDPAIVDLDAWSVGPGERFDAGTFRRRRRPDAGPSEPSDEGGFGCTGLGFSGLEVLLALGLIRRRKRT